MPNCPHCGRALFSGEQACRTCSSPEPVVEDALAAEGDLSAELERRVAVACFRNGAEAGFFADELTRTTGVVPDVLARERFDAVHATWSLDYLLLVDADDALAAAQKLQALVEADADDEEHGTRRAGELPAGLWVPLILTLAASSIACFGIERAERPFRPAGLIVRDPRDPPDLWQVLAAGQGTWTQALEDGPGERTLTLNAADRTGVMTEDLNGDGRPEREWRFGWGR
ncbi:MAG: hypothetical protein ACT4QC_03020 [Planctomycetaceae bacterium]